MTKVFLSTGRPSQWTLFWCGAREFALVVIGFSLLTAALTYPLSFGLSTLAYRSLNGDGQFSVWNVAWVARALLTDPRHVLDANIFYPHRGTLTYSEMNLAAGALAVPAYWATGSAYAAHNVAVLLSFVLSATGMYYLARYLSGDRRAAIVGAIGFAFCPYVFAHLLHIQLLMTAGLPWSVLAFHRMADRPTPVRGAALGLAMAAEAYACGYYAVFVMLVVGFVVLTTAISRGLWRNLRYWTTVGMAALVAGAASAPLAAPLLSLRQSGFNRPLGAARQYAADWRAYLASSAVLHDWMLKYLGHWSEVLFPGFIIVILGASGAVIGWRAGGRRRETAGLYAGLTVAAVWASFGPDAGLYRVMYETIPAFSLMRAPSRFGLVVVFGLSVLASLGAAALFGRVRRPALVAVALLAATAAEGIVSLQFDRVPPIDPAYRLLATLPYGAVLELPVYSYPLRYMRSQYMLNSTAHWMPLVDGYSDYIPPDFDARADVLGEFPTREALKDLERDHVRYAVIHLDPYEKEMRTSLDGRLREYAPYLHELYGDTHTLLYEIASYPK